MQYSEWLIIIAGTTVAAVLALLLIWRGLWRLPKLLVRGTLGTLIGLIIGLPAGFAVAWFRLPFPPVIHLPGVAITGSLATIVGVTLMGCASGWVSALFGKRQRGAR